MQQAQVDFVKVSSFVLAMGCAGRALGIVAVSFFLGRELTPQEKDLADSPTAVRRERPKNQ